MLPDFAPRTKVEKQQAKGQRRKISSHTTELLMAQGHARFRETLAHKAEEFDTRVELVREDYTSMTCGRCGALNRGLKLTHRTFVCPTCAWTCPRDVNGARNVLIRRFAEVIA